jgi:ABC-type Fe3+/spermidine/putrescine transport system ATPase subunit
VLKVLIDDTMMTLVQLRNITKQYDHSTRDVLQQVNLDIHERGILCDAR